MALLADLSYELYEVWDLAEHADDVVDEENTVGDRGAHLVAQS